MPTAFDPRVTPRRFTFHGPIRIWDSEERRLSMGGRDLWLGPDVQSSQLEVGMEIVAKGYEGQQAERWIVDLLTVTSTVKAWRRPVAPGTARRRF